MGLTAGEQLSFYEILGSLGAGAMGEVYRARDTRLDREVALKVLPEHFAEDAERLLRFEREAKSLASLNHPNVAQIFGVDQVDDTCFLVLELVPGETLEQRIARGPLAVHEAVDVCRQIAEGLEAAHEAGVVHRDLKPANVHVTPDGKVKVLDFGLAKSNASGSGQSTSVDSVLATEEGRLLGTPTYMAPEQARGKPIDRRVDVWALGCVLYECLTARRAFPGETIPDVLACVLEREPDWSRLPPLPLVVEQVLHRCLEKDAHVRLRDVGEARIALGAAAVRSGAPSSPGASPVRPWMILCAIGMAAIGGLIAWLVGEVEVPVRELRLSIDVEVAYQDVFPRIAPNGETVVHGGVLLAADGEPVVRALFRRDLDAFGSTPLADTENPVTFCFSPDSKHLAVLVERSGRDGELTLMRVALDGAAPNVRLGPWPARHRRNGGLAWIENDVIVGSADPEQLILFSIATRSVEVRPIERAFERPGSGVDVFRALGDGRHVLGRANYYSERGYFSAVVSVDVTTGVERVVEHEAEFGTVLGERLLFSRSDTLFTGSFDWDLLQLRGVAQPLADGLRTATTWRGAWFDVARDGTLIWLPGGLQGARRYLSVVDPSGHVEPFWPERMAHDAMILCAPDGSFCASLVVSDDGQRIELWGSEGDSPQLRRLLAAPGTDFLNGHPLPGGKELIYQRLSSDGALDGIYRGPVDGGREPQLLVPAVIDGPDYEPVAVSPDGDYMIVSLNNAEGVSYSTVSTAGGGAPNALPLLSASGDRYWPKISSDGRWLVHVINEVDRARCVVQELRDRQLVGRKLAVPTPDNEIPWDLTWTKNPKTGRLGLLVVGRDRSSIFEVPFLDEEVGTLGAPQLRTTLSDALVLDLAPLGNGRTLLLLQDPEEGGTDRISVVIGAVGSD